LADSPHTLAHSVLLNFIKVPLDEILLRSDWEQNNGSLVSFHALFNTHFSLSFGTPLTHPRGNASSPV